MLKIVQDLREAGEKGRDIREVLEPGAPIEIGKVDQFSKSVATLKGLNMRVGVHTGKVIAGVIGGKLVRYDVFGPGVDSVFVLDR